MLSGNHTNIEGWRQELSILRTKERRPDLYETYREQQKEMQEKNKRKRRFKGVIFDMDGCLIDSERLYAQCWKMAFHKMGIPISDETLDSWNGIGGKDLDLSLIHICIDLTQTSYSTIPSVDMELGNACSDHSDEALSRLADGLIEGVNGYFD